LRLLISAYRFFVYKKLQFFGAPQFQLPVPTLLEV
jgi:hypothetical protein